MTGINLGNVSSGNATTSTGFTEIWNGTTWQLAKVTWPKGTADSVLVGVSCYAAHSCEAVGADGANVTSVLSSGGRVLQRHGGGGPDRPGAVQGRLERVLLT